MSDAWKLNQILEALVGIFKNYIAPSKLKALEIYFKNIQDFLIT